MKFAEWLLRVCGVEETLLGDLVEERGARRSAWWFVWQAAVAVAAHVARDLRKHPVQAIRAIATGWVLTLAGAQLLQRFQPRPYEWGRHTVFKFLLVFTFLIWPAFVGWLIAHTHRAQHAAMVLAYVASGVIWSIYYYTVHFEEITPIPNQLSTDVLLTCAILLSTLVGGFLHRPDKVRPQTEPRP